MNSILRHSNASRSNYPNLFDLRETFDKDKDHDEVSAFYHEKNLGSGE
jgi:hypothetical protein